MIEECKELYIGNKNIDILFKHEGNYSQSIFDKERISQVLRNLVVNAIKFTSQGNITIELIKTTIEIDNKQTEAFSVSIADEGMGIPESELETIFDNFRQSSRSINISGGTGLGLSISREIIKAHNGKIWAENLPTRGAKFTFILPIQPPNTLPEGNYNIPITILMLDDEETCLASMAVLLYNTPYTLIQFTSGQAGLDYLAQYPGTVDLIFLDLMMPDMYGLDFISRLKQQEGLKYIPVILQSGISDDDEITKALEMGVEGFIRKPYQKEQILNSIYQILAKRL
jgi:two-component system sensor histidine kinase ChiS